MKKKWWVIPAAIVGLPLFIFLGGEVVKLLWNWLLPPLFGWRLLTFWQAFGLLALCRILFGGLGGHGHGPGRRWDRRCKKMTPEEREKFRQAIADGFSIGQSASEKPAQ